MNSILSAEGESQVALGPTAPFMLQLFHPSGSVAMKQFLIALILECSALILQYNSTISADFSVLLSDALSEFADLVNGLA